MRGIKTREEKKWKNMAIFISLVLILILLLNSVRNVHNKKIEAEETLARMEKEVSELEGREKYLVEALARIETEEGMKYEMRKKLNVAEAGENVAIIVFENQESSSSSLELSVWQKFKNFWIDLFR